MIDESAIRAALTSIADQAPDAVPVQAALAARRRRHVQRRLMLRWAGTGLAAATVTATGLGVHELLRRDENPDPQQVSGGPGGGWLEVPLQYRPTWLPDSLGESSRTVLLVDGQAATLSRDWLAARNVDGIERFVSLVVGWHESLDQQLTAPQQHSTTVDVGGVPGELSYTDPISRHEMHLRWQPPGAPPFRMSVSVGAEVEATRAAALRVARSLRRDPVGRMWVGPRFGWLPATLANKPVLFQVYQRGTTWGESLHWQDMPAFDVAIGPNLEQARVDGQSTQPLEIRGLHGLAVPDATQVVLTLADGVQASFRGKSAPPLDPRVTATGQPNPMDDLVHIVERFDFGPWPDMSWVGSR